jgi:acetyl esterase/lipase
MPDGPGASIAYDRLMQANLVSVFNERDAGKRIRAIGELYVDGAVLYEPDTAAQGHAAISEAVTRLLAGLPPTFVFTATGPALGHHGVGRLRWQAGPPNGPAAVNGMDIAHVQDGRIHSLYVFIEPAA